MIEDKKDELRTIVRYQIDEFKNRPIKRNLNKKELLALKELQQDKDIMIVKADKGNCSVIMNAIEYQNGIEKEFSKSSYRKTNNDPIDKLQREVLKIYKGCIILNNVNRNDIIMDDPHVPKLYGFPKIHKNISPPPLLDLLL